MRRILHQRRSDGREARYGAPEIHSPRRAHGAAARRWPALAVAVSSALCGVLVSCATKHETPAAHNPVQGTVWRPTQHWLYDQRIRTVMRELRDAVREMPDLPADDDASGVTTDVRYQFEAAALLADKLANAAGRLPDSIEHLNVSVADRTAFLEQAKAMNAQAVRLGRAARERDVDAMQRQLDAVTTTCVSCHTRFRDFTTELLSPRV